jgi:hypothetical protein
MMNRAWIFSFPESHLVYCVSLSLHILSVFPDHRPDHFDLLLRRQGYVILGLTLFLLLLLLVFIYFEPSFGPRPGHHMYATGRAVAASVHEPMMSPIESVKRNEAFKSRNSGLQSPLLPAEVRTKIDYHAID